ncbi:MAG TPA: ATP-binding protein [Vicinamibacterales bacterium]|nr:ATP-binding protein [Vicinamibacterales bacterium]
MTRWWRSHSVRLQLTLWYVAAMTLVLGVYAGAILAYVSRSASQILNQQLRSDFQWATVMVEQTPEGGITWNGEEAIEEHPWLQIWSSAGKLLFRNDVALAQPDVGMDLPNLPDDAVVSVPTAGVPLRVLSRRGEIAGSPVVIQVGRSEEVMRQQIRTVALILLLGLPLAVATAGFGGYLLARRALAPIERMTERAETITAERLSDRLPVSDPDNEMGRLATVFNATLARLQESFDQMRRFTADVSHELRTPLTAIRSVGEVGLRGGSRAEGEYRIIIGSMLEEVDRLAGLVDRLLTLSRAERGEAKLSIEPIALKELAESVVGDLAVLAEEKSQQVVVEAHGSPRAVGDRMMVRQALINLVDNAIKFAPAASAIVIRVADTADHAVVDVIDRGPGVPAAARDRIFDRFFRASSAPADVTGTGLGLSIAKSAVETVSGTLTLEHSDPGGSTFRITLPRG